MSNFQYDALPEGSIRLLKVNGLNSDGRIETSLDPCEITSEPEFYALSYAWGSDVTNKAIVCNGQDLPVTTSVHEALTALGPMLRLNKSGIPIWIDAVCINQRDDAERGHQVARMDRVYRQAKCVIVWLGKGDEDTDLAMESMSELTMLLATSNPTTSFGQEFSKRFDSPEVPPFTADPACRGLGKLLEREWFSRLWTFQEALLATSMKFVCGMYLVDSELFIKLMSEVEHRGLSLRCESQDTIDKIIATLRWIERDSLSGWTYILAHKSFKGCLLTPGETSTAGTGFGQATRHNSASSIPLTGLAICTADRRCKEPLDRVYALLSLASDELRNRITVSYTRGLNEVLVEVGKACLQYESLDYLQLVGDKPVETVLPTWCADLTATSDSHKFLDLHAGAGFVPGYCERQVRTFPHTNNIDIAGFRAETVSQVMDPFDTPGLGENRTEKLCTWLMSCLEFALRTIQAQSPEKDAVPQEKEHPDNILLSHIYTVTATTITTQPDGEALKRRFRGFIDEITAHKESDSITKTLLLDRARLAARVIGELQHCEKAAYFTTVKGKVGIGPVGTKPGDTVAVFFGGGLVYVLRERTEEQTFGFIGSAFIHGLMELSRTRKEDIGETEWFTLI